MKYIIYTFTLFIFFSTACEDNSTEPEEITCFNDGYAQGGECVCAEGYTGETCNQQQTPDVINVSEILVTQFPSTTEDGAGWDPASGPDILPFLSKDNEIVWESDTYYEDASNQNTYSFEPDIQLTEPNQQYQIDLYDYDEASQSDFMGGVESIPYSSDNGFPDTLTYDAGGGVAFDLVVSYAW